MIRTALGTTALVLWLATAHSPARAQTDYEAWPLLSNPFESTTGAGVMIDGYDPVVSVREGRPVCTTDFSVSLPNGTTLQNTIVFDAKPAQGGILCTAGRWRAKDGRTSGTTPFEVFIKEGIRRRTP